MAIWRYRECHGLKSGNHPPMIGSGQASRSVSVCDNQRNVPVLALGGPQIPQRLTACALNFQSLGQLALTLTVDLALFILSCPLTFLFDHHCLATHQLLPSLFYTPARQRRALHTCTPRRCLGAFDEFQFFCLYFGFCSFLVRTASTGVLSSIVMPSPAIFGTRPQRPRELAYSRDSNRDTLRASVLDVALELGIGTSRAVENLIFDSVLEEDEVSVLLGFACFPTSMPSHSPLSSNLMNGGCHVYDTPVNQSVIMLFSFGVHHPLVRLPTGAPFHCSYEVACHRWGIRASGLCLSRSHHGISPRCRFACTICSDPRDTYRLFPVSDYHFLQNVTTPTLTSASAATSDESWPLVPAWNSIPADLVLPVSKPTNVTRAPTFDSPSGRAQSEDSHTPTPPLPHQPRKLRKARKDGYESDGGYLSDNLKKKDKKDPKKGSGSSFGPEYQSDSEQLSVLAKRGADKKKKQKGSKMSDDLGADPSVKTFNVSTKKSRIPSDDGDVSDGAHLSEAAGKKKRSFFSRRSRSPSATRKGFQSDTPPPVPTLPPTPILTSGDSTRGHTFNSLGGSNPNGGTPIWAANSTVLPSLDERPDFSTSIQTRERSPSPSSASRSYGVRFTPSTRFDSSATPSSSPAVMITSEEPPLHPKSIAPHTLRASPSPGPPSPVSPVWQNEPPMSAPSASRHFLSPDLRSTPSLGTLTPPPPRGVSPAFSESSIVSSSDFIVPSPRPRFFEDLPPPSPPPTGPLPEVPFHGPYSHMVPQVRRGRQAPFPMRGVLPVQEASRLIERTERRRLGAQTEMPAESVDDAINSDVYDDLSQLSNRVVLVSPSPPHDDSQEDEFDWPDDESVRPDIAQFYFFETSSPGGGGVGRIAPLSPDEPDDLSKFKFPFVRSFPSENIPASPITPSVPSDIHSYYSEGPGRDAGGEDIEGRSHFFDDEHSRAMRARLMARADAFQGTERNQPVPKLRPF